MEKTGRIEDQNGGVAPIQATKASYNKKLLLVFIGAILPGIVAIFQTNALGGDVVAVRSSTWRLS